MIKVYHVITHKEIAQMTLKKLAKLLNGTAPKSKRTTGLRLRESGQPIAYVYTLRGEKMTRMEGRETYVYVQFLPAVPQVCQWVRESKVIGA